MSLAVSIDDGAGVPAAMQRRLRTEVGRMVRAAARRDRRDDYDVSLRLVGDAAIRALNRDYRAKNRPTDVLAFAQREAASADQTLLGDIVISVQTAKGQAKAGLYAELMHLASHGLCHLLGYDHNDDAEEAEMNARAAVLRKEAARTGRVRAG